jgi:hypothetical protein
VRDLAECNTLEADNYPELLLLRPMRRVDARVVGCRSTAGVY